MDHKLNRGGIIKNKNPKDVELDVGEVIVPLKVFEKERVKEMSIQEIVNQLEACNYECEAGPLENNTAFIELKKRAQFEASFMKILDQHTKEQLDSR